MRKLLALLSICLLAGLVVVMFSRRPAQSGLAAVESIHDSKAKPPATELSTDLATQPADAATREELVAVAQEATPKTASETAKLILHVRNQRTHAPFSGVRVMALARASPNSELRQGMDSMGTHGTLSLHPKTGASGTVDLALPAGVELRVWVSGEREACSATCLDIPPLAEGETRELDVDLLPPNDAQLVGRVVDYMTKEPVAGASVRLMRSIMTSTSTGETDWHNDALGSVKSRGDGSFEFTFTSWVLPHLQVDAAGYSRALLELSTRHADAAHALVVEMLQECRLIVHVIDASGSAIPGVQVSVDSHGWGNVDELPRDPDESHAQISDQSWSARTQADGRATIAGLPASMELRVKGVKDSITIWSEVEPLELEYGETRELEWRIGGGTRLSGIVFDQYDRPAPQQELWITKRYTDTAFYYSAYGRGSATYRATTDAAGRFVFENVRAGRWSIGPAASEEWSHNPAETAAAPRAVPLDLADEPERELALHIERGIFIRGVVLAPDHATLHGAFVQFEGGDGLGIPVTEQGAFVIGPLSSGDCTLVASCQGHYADSEPVRARGGDTNVKLQLRLGGGLQGVVIDAATGQPCKAEIVFSPRLEGLGPSSRQSGSSTGADGTFTIPGLAPGRYDLAAMSEDGRCAVQAGLEVSAGVETARIVLALKLGGSIRFTYHGAQELMNVTATSSGVPLCFPMWIRANVRGVLWAPAGTVVLQIRKEYKGRARTQQIELQVGETRELEITDED